MINDRWLDEIIEKIHGIQNKELTGRYCLRHPSSVKTLRDLPIAQNGPLFAITESATELLDLKKDTILFGGPCICYCQANIQKITVQDMIDTLYPILVAVNTGLECVIYLQTYEAKLQQMAIDGVEASQEKWDGIYSFFEQAIQKAIAEYGAEKSKIHIVSSSKSGVQSIIDNCIYKDRDMNFMPDDSLYGLYSLNGSSFHPKGSPYEQMFLDIYRRNLVAYLPNIVSQFIGKDYTHILCVENATQMKASQTANWINKKLMKTQEDRIGCLAYVSTPGKTTREMCMSFDRHKIYLEQTSLSRLKEELSLSDDLVKTYYENAFGGLDNMISAINMFVRYQ